MSPTMVFEDEDRDLVFVWHGDTTVQVYTAKGWEDHAKPFDTIDVEEDGEPAICSLGGLRCEADAYVSFYETDRCAECPKPGELPDWDHEDTHPMIESSGYGTDEYLAAIL